MLLFLYVVHAKNFSFWRYLAIIPKIFSYSLTLIYPFQFLTKLANPSSSCSILLLKDSNFCLVTNCHKPKPSLTIIILRCLIPIVLFSRGLIQKKLSTFTIFFWENRILKLFPRSQFLIRLL